MVPAVYISETQFHTAGNVVEYLPAGRKLKLYQAPNDDVVIEVTDAVYDVGNSYTVVTVSPNMVATTLTGIQHTPDIPISGAIHYHTSHDDGGPIPAASLTQEQITNLIVIGASISVGRIDLDFTYNTGSPLTILNVEENTRVTEVSINLTEVFNDAAATLSVGHVGNAQGLMTQTDNVAQEIAEYSVAPNIVYAGADVIYLTINKGTSNQGGGTVSVLFDAAGG